MAEFFVLILLLLCSINFSSETVTSFDTNFDSVVCTNAEAVISCSTDSELLRWEESGANDDVTFNTGSLVGSIKTIGMFTIVLDEITSDDVISSTATVNVTTGFANGTSITCFDSISLTANEETAVIYVADIPGPPKNFRNTSVTFSSVTLSWSEPTAVSGISITEYNIDIIKPVGTPCPANRCSSLSPSTSTVTIDNLSFNTEYTFVISATSCGGVGLNASLDVYLIGEAPDPPLAIDTCISLMNKGKEMNLRVSWECPSVNEVRVPPISNYVVDVQSTPSALVNPIDGVSVLADCRCTYSTSIQLQEVMNVMYTAAVSSNNTVGSNSQTISLYSSANITTSTAQATVSTALIAVFISWTACEGLSADVILTYYRSTSSLVELSVTSQVTLPVDTAFISLNNLLPGTSYGYTVSLRSSGGIILGVTEEGTFETNNADDAIVITETVCTSTTSTTRQGVTTSTTRSNGETPNAGTPDRIEDCPATTNNTLLIGIGVLAAVAIAFLVMFIVVLFICIRTVITKKEDTLNTVALLDPPPPPTPSSHGYELNDVTPPVGVSTDMNMSYGHMYSSLRTSDNDKNPTYEEINKTNPPNLTNRSSPYESNRPPIPVPYAEPVVKSTQDSDYVNPDIDMEPDTAPANSERVDNPAYGTIEKEGQQPSSTNEEYLIVS